MPTATTRWSIIIPLSWAKVFWITFISKGAHAIGLREKQWIACEAGLPFFPSYFPGCNAYLSSMATEGASVDLKAEQLHTAVRPLKVLIPPPWNSIAVQGAPISSAEDMVYCNTLSNAPCGHCNTTSLTVDSNSSMQL